MASNYTEHYKLNQWSPEDKVLRTEFNEDNQKIDAALGGMEAEMGKKADRSMLESLATALREEILWRKVVDITLTEASAVCTLELQDIEQYQHLNLYYTISGPQAATLLWNETYLISLFSESTAVVLSTGRVEFFPVNHNSLFLSHQNQCDVTSGGSVDQDFGAQKKVTLSGPVSIQIKATNGKLAAGNHFVIYGMRR